MFSDIAFDESLWLWLFALIPFALAASWIAARHTTLFVSDGPRQPGRRWAMFSQRGMHVVGHALLAVGCTLLILSIARPKPTASLAETATVAEARDIVFVLDDSLSMVGGVNLERGGMRSWEVKYTLMIAYARTLIAHAARERRSDRIGIIAFGDEPRGIWPLTVDYAQLLRLLPRQGQSFLPDHLRGTHIKRAIWYALEYLERAGKSTTQIVVMITDGLDTLSQQDQEAFAERWRVMRSGVLLPKLRREFVLVGFGMSESTSLFTLCRLLGTPKQSEQCFLGSDPVEVGSMSEKVERYLASLPRGMVEVRTEHSDVLGARQDALAGVFLRTGIGAIALWMLLVLLFRALPLVSRAALGNNTASRLSEIERRGAR